MIKKIIIASTLSLIIISNSFAENKLLYSGIAVTSGAMALSTNFHKYRLDNDKMKFEREVRMKKAIDNFNRSMVGFTDEIRVEKIKILEDKIESISKSTGTSLSSEVLMLKDEILILKKLPTMSELERKALEAQARFDFAQASRLLDPELKSAEYRLTRAIMILSYLTLIASVVELKAE